MAVSEDSAASLARVLVRYDDLIPCTTAFVDTRTPGSDQKENFTIIGPGVAENPDQHVHIKQPHGFNIGGARQPPHCVNSQHSHETAEVFVVHTGRWAFFTGERGQDGRVEMGPGDVISIPVRAFRGFENIGEEPGFLFAVLGGDDPGSVLWAPYVFEAAASYGLVLLENGQLIDTAAGEQVPPDAVRMPVTSAAQIAALQTLDSAALANCVVSRSEITQTPAINPLGAGVTETPVIGAAAPQQTGSAQTPAAGKLSWPHGFQLRHLQLDGNAAASAFSREQAEVYLMHAGTLEVTFDNITVTLGPGDVLTVPAGASRKISNPGGNLCEAYVVHGTDTPATTLLAR